MLLRFLTASLVFVAVGLLTPIDAADEKTTKQQGGQRKRVCLISDSFPWMSGLELSKMYRVSQLLADKGHDTLWMTQAGGIPEGTYDSWKKLKPHQSDTVEPPKDFDIEHLTFLGGGDLNGAGIKGKDEVLASSLNRLAKKYSIDTYITELDLDKMVTDVEFTVPVIRWVRSSPADPQVLSHYHAVAGLTTRVVEAIKEAVPDMTVQFVPHVVERDELSKRATKGEQYLAKYTPEDADSVLEGKPAKMKQWSDLIPVLSGQDRDSFVVLLQGELHSEQDQKHFDRFFRGYKQFYKTIFGNETKTPIHKEHLYINSNAKFENVKIPGRYTIDNAKHRPEVIAALQKRANICVNPSTTYGIEVVECQALETPVVTIQYGDMPGMTKFGRSKLYDEDIKNELLKHYNTYTIANKIKSGALKPSNDGNIGYNVGAALIRNRQQELEQALNWVDKQFDSKVVGDAFSDLISAADGEFAVREMRHSSGEL